MIPYAIKRYINTLAEKEIFINPETDELLFKIEHVRFPTEKLPFAGIGPINDEVYYDISVYKTPTDKHYCYLENYPIITKDRTRYFLGYKITILIDAYVKRLRANDSLTDIDYYYYVDRKPFIR